jgi:hypothetical protein
MRERPAPWPDLVEQALFDKTSAQRQMISNALRAIEARLFDLEIEKEMLREARQKLEAAAN